MGGVGGDWFDVIPLSGARVALVVGDVVGHGIQASATMGRLRTAVRTLADVDLPPDELLTHLDDLVTRLADEDADGEYDPDADPDIVGATCLYAGLRPGLPRLHPGARGSSTAPHGHSQGNRRPPRPPGRSTAGPGWPALRISRGGTGRGMRHGAQSVLPDRPQDDIALLIARPNALDAGQVATWDIPADPAAVAQARKNVSAQVAEWGHEEALFATELVVSELVTNAIRYGEPPIQLRLIHDRTLICEVTDASNTAPHLRRARVFDEGGRGLLLVAQLTQGWGTRQSSTGKTIWAEQALPNATPNPGKGRVEAGPVAAHRGDRDPSPDSREGSLPRPTYPGVAVRRRRPRAALGAPTCGHTSCFQTGRPARHVRAPFGRALPRPAVAVHAGATLPR
ncbi:serine/threonine-protein phosphatase [Streptomyces akebiae]|uniref:Serine/threonine-protein phosphatase n=1 Tax=Streptomyces akebiae TaxID=2865673 RepID=A0ABX8XLH0_9ACTN|nr:serine/threonine-protein phosphatase [Streptomyces akebiae]